MPTNNMLTGNDIVIITTAQAEALIDGINKLAPDNKATRYDVLRNAGLLDLYIHLREATEKNNRNEVTTRDWWRENYED